MLFKRSTLRSEDPAHPAADSEHRWSLAQSKAREAALRLAQRFESEVRLPEPAHEPVREAAYRTWLSERSGMPLAALESAPPRAAELELIDPIEGLTRLCVALRRDDGGPDLVLADPFDRGTRWWLESRLRAAGHPRTRWFVATDAEVSRYWRQVMRDVPLSLPEGIHSPDKRLTQHHAPETPLLRPASVGTDTQPLGPSAGQPALRLLREMVRKGLAGGARALRWTQAPQGELSVDWRLSCDWVPAGADAQRRFAADLATPLWDELQRLSQAHGSAVPGVQVGALRLPRAGRVYRCPVHLSLHTDGTRMATLDLPAPHPPEEAQAQPHPLSLDPDTAGFLRTALDRPHGLIVLASPPESGKSTLLQNCLTEAWALRPGAAVLRVLDESAARARVAPTVASASSAGTERGTAASGSTDEHAFDDDEPLSPAGRPTWTAHWPAHGDALAASDALNELCTSLQPALVLIDEAAHPSLVEWAVTQAAAGRLVVATLSATSGPVARARLRQMLGLAGSDLLDAVLLGVLTQRLLPRVCPVCAGPARVSDGELRRAGLHRAQIIEEGWMLARADGCEACHGLGHANEQVAIHHWWNGPDRPGSVLSLREGAMEQVRWGVVTLEEADRAVALDE